jgi:hypothetical protein
VGDFTNELLQSPIDRMVILYVVCVFEFSKHYRARAVPEEVLF